MSLGRIGVGILSGGTSEIVRGIKGEDNIFSDLGEWGEGAMGDIGSAMSPAQAKVPNVGFSHYDDGTTSGIDLGTSALRQERNVSNYQPGVGMSQPLQDINSDAYFRGLSGQNTLGAYGQGAAAIGNEAADYGVAAGGNAMNAGANAYDAGVNAAGYGRAGAELGQGAMANAYGAAGNIAHAGNIGATTGEGAMANAYGAGNAAAALGAQGMANAQRAGSNALQFGNAGFTNAGTAAQNINAAGKAGIGQADFGFMQSEGGRVGQMRAADRLTGLESTEGPSAAQAQLNQATSRGLDDALNMARSGRGFGGGAAASAQALRAQPQLAANAANQSAMLRAQENAAWRQRQGSNLANAAGAYGASAQTGLSQGQLGLAATGQQAQAAQAAGQLGLAGAGLGAQTALSEGQLGLSGANQAAQAQLAGGQLGLQGANTAIGAYGQQANALNSAGQLGLAGADRSLAGINMGMQGEQARMQGAQAQGQLNVAGGQLGLQGLNQGMQGQVAGGQLAGAGYGLGFQGDQVRGQSIAQDQAAKLAYENMLTQQQGIKAGVAIGNAQSQNGFMGSMVGAGAGLLAMLSDERQKVKLSSPVYGNPYGRRGAPGGAVMSDANSKQEIAKLRGMVNAYQSAYKGPAATEGVRKGGAYMPGETPSARFPSEGSDTATQRQYTPDFRNAPASAYVYKDPSLPGAQPGVQVGPMAQDLEKGAPGTVFEGPYGKMVDPGRLTMANSSAIGEQQARQDDLERQMAELKAMLDSNSSRTRQGAGIGAY